MLPRSCHVEDRILNKLSRGGLLNVSWDQVTGKAMKPKKLVEEVSIPPRQTPLDEALKRMHKEAALQL